MAFEFNTVRNASAENLMNWFEEGWEVYLQYYESVIENVMVSDEVPQYQYVTNSSGYYGNQQPVYVNKTVPVVKQNPVFVLRRSAPAKVLYGQKNDNTTY